MFIVFLKFTEEKSRASQFMEAHMQWVKQGLDEGVFLLVGGIQPNLGGAIIAFNTSYSELQSRVEQDPFVAENIVSSEIIEISPNKVDERLSFLMA